MWNRADSFRIQITEINYLRGAGIVSRWDGVNIAKEYRKCRMLERRKGMGCGFTEGFKQNALEWFGYVELMDGDRQVEKILGRNQNEKD